MVKYNFDTVTKEELFCRLIGWRKLFEQTQDILREIRKQELLPDELYLKTIRLCDLECLPKKYTKGVKNG